MSVSSRETDLPVVQTAGEPAAAPTESNSILPSGAGSNETEGWSLPAWVLQDWRVNATRPDSRIVLMLFRCGQWSFRNWGFAGRLIGILCQVLSSVVFGVELPSGLRIGPRLRLYHPHSIVLNPSVEMGADCHLRQGTTIGNRISRAGVDLGSPQIGNGVDLGATCVVLGPIQIGDQARIGALAVATKSVPAWGVLVGNPGRVIRVDEPTPP